MSGLVYKGEMRRVGDHWEGFFANEWDWRVVFTGTVSERDGVKFLELIGTPDPAPECLLLPGEAGYVERKQSK